MLTNLLLMTAMLQQVRTPALVPAPGSILNPQQLPPGTATLDGVVTILGTSDPVSGAAVEIRKSECARSGGEVLSTSTGPDGKFSFKQVRAGKWCIGAAKAGGVLSPVEFQQRNFKGRGLALDVADSQQVQNIRLEMPRTGSISGRVLDSDGEPMVHARILAMEPFYQDGVKRLYTLNAVQTNDRGEFSLFWLPPGEYYVAAVVEDPLRQQVMYSVAPPGTGGHRADAMPPVVTRRNLPDGGFVEDVYVPVYYGGGSDPLRAQAIDVRPASSNVIELSFAGARARSFHIRGRAMNGVTGQPAAGAQIRLVPKDWTATAIVPYANVDKAGNFDIKGVVAGSYALYAAASTVNPGAPNPALQGIPAAQLQQLLAQGVNIAGSIPIGVRLPVEMGNQNVENVSLTLLPGGSLTGELIFEGSLAGTITPDVKSSLRIGFVRDPDIPSTPGAGPQAVSIARNASDNTFRLQNVFVGDYRALVAPFINPFSWTTPALPESVQNLYVKSIRFGSRDVLAEGLRLATNNPDQVLQIVIATGGKLEGTVMNERNDAMGNTKVVLVPDLAYRNRTDLYRSAITEASGKFRIQGVPAGDYRVLAWEDIPDGAWQNAEVLRGVESRGKVVHVIEGGESTTELVAIPRGRQ